MYIMEYSSTIKNEEILPFATTWMDLEGTMPSEIRAKKPQQTHGKGNHTCGYQK